MNYSLASLALLLLLLSACGNGNELPQEETPKSFKWKVSPEQNPQPNSKMDSLLFNIKNGVYGYIDEVFIAKNDTVLLQERFNLDYEELSKDIKGKMGCGSNMCEDSSEIHLYNYYHPKYHPYYTNSQLHTLQSITKSVASTLIGSVIYQGKLSGVEASILPYFEKYPLSDTIKNHLASTSIKDVLTMQLGLEWKEFGLALEMESSVGEMELSEDWIAYVLEQKVETEKKWNYSSGASQLLSQIIKEATGQTIDEYSRTYLFKELGIEDFYWKKTPTGLPDTESGLYLKAEDLAKIGLLHLQNGTWNGKRLLPKTWTKEAWSKQVIDIYQDGGKEGYGYQWWITAHEAPLAVGLGYGNQILLLIPEQNIIGVVYAWNVFDNEGQYIFGDLVEALASLE